MPIASSISLSFFNEWFTLRKETTDRWKQSQSVRLLYNLQGLEYNIIFVLSDVSTGEWSDERSEQDLHSNKVLRRPLIMQKSIKSGIFIIMVGQ